MGLPPEDAVVKKLQDPEVPSKEMVDMHYVMGHIPFRSWCPVCVKAFGREMDHRRDSGKWRKLQETSTSQTFMSSEGLGCLQEIFQNDSRTRGLQ